MVSVLASELCACWHHNVHTTLSLNRQQRTHDTGVRRGTCIAIDEVGGERRVPLEAGTSFVIPANVLHAFETSESDTLDVIAFHPDSDFGPAPTDHPMINRTVVGGVSASLLPDIQTCTTVS